jgi:hypothetical protein
MQCGEWTVPNEKTPPQGRIEPKIEIVLFDAEAALSAPKAEGEPLVTATAPTASTALERQQISDAILAKILKNSEYKQIYENKKTNLEQSDFRKNITKSLNIQTPNAHPLNGLLTNNATLVKQLTRFTADLALGPEQYDALLDVFSQRGEEGLTQLFDVWDELNKENILTFKEMHRTILKNMPSYLPFINDPELKETLIDIARLGTEKYSWWKALISNHSDIKGYGDLSSLFQEFNKTWLCIEGMGLKFDKIEAFKSKSDLSTTLSNMLSLLNKCAKKDRGQQLACIHDVPLEAHDKYYFIIPEMDLLHTMSLTFEDLKTQNDPTVIKQLVYRYLATQKFHLPLTDYAEYLNAILNSTFSEEYKCKMAYLLAKTTSAAEDTGFNHQETSKEWKDFNNRFDTLESVTRMQVNSGIAEYFFGLMLKAEGGFDGARLTGINPFMDMNPIPPISFLNKLLKASEYKFLNPKLQLTQMKGVQLEMMEEIKTAAYLYTEHPGMIMQAARFIKTETVTANAAGKFYPEDRDIHLLENFIKASNTLLDQKYNPKKSEGRNPQDVLLPLLTVFQLEYASNDELIQLIDTYNTNLTSSNPEHQTKIQTLLPYALSLFQMANNRKSFTHETLSKIQKELIDAITKDNITSNQGVRDWIMVSYNDNFPTNTLKNLNDPVEINFEEKGITNPDTRKIMNDILSFFNKSDEEQRQLNELANDLIKFDEVFRSTPSETLRFYEYCAHALKTGGFLARDKQAIPPSYLQQFQTLIQTLTKTQSIEAFEQFMEDTQDRVSQGMGDGNHSLAKCNYLLETLYPTLLQEKDITPKEAFRFASELVYNSPQDSLISPIKGITTAISEEEKQKKIDEKHLKISQLHEKIEHIYIANGASPEELQDLKRSLEDIVSSLTRDHDLFSTYQKVITTIQDLQTEDQNYFDALKKKNIFGKILFALTQPSSEISQQTRLLQAGLFELTQPDGPLMKDVTEAVHRQGVSFEKVALDLYHKKIEFLKKYESLTSRAHDFISNALRMAPESPHQNHTLFTTLIDQLIALDDNNLVLSLMYHYNGALPERKVKDLADLLSTVKFTVSEPTVRNKVIHAIVSQLNNGVDCTMDDIRAFIKHMNAHQDKPVFLKYLNQYYQRAPFPKLSDFIQWTTDLNDEPTLNGAYACFDKNPCARETNNGFKDVKATEQLALMPGAENIFTPSYLNAIEQAATEGKTLSTEALLEAVKKFKDQAPKDHITLAMYTIELLHRSKGKPGNSFELNTTQIMSILAILDTGKKVTAEIGTGEGKSRIMMVLNACQFLKGNTVDFLTSDLALAERDYIIALPFYNSLGAKVNFITATSKIEDYQMDGINVSDPANLCLFRSKAFSNNQAAQVLNPDPKKRAMHLDEADVSYFDASNKQYNYSSETPQQNIDVLPLYPILMDFFSREENEKFYLNDKEQCNKKLLAKIKQDNSKLHALIKNAPTLQLEKWTNAAYIARGLKYNVDYTVVTDATTPTTLGHKKIAAAKCLIGSRISDQGQFADGVHQCLHAELNRLMKNSSEIHQTSDPHLQNALIKCQNLNRSFQVTPERKITYSTSSDSMLKSYSEGYLYGVTGTQGMELEKLEAQTNFDTQFLKIPKHNGQRRVDRPTLIKETDDRHVDALVEHILDSVEKNQPILMMCKDHNESQELYAKLVKRLSMTKPYTDPEYLKRIDAENYRDGNTEVAKFLQKSGGRPGQVIITTELLGRGIEYPLKDEATEAGLKVLLTFLPKGERLYGQSIGRSGRYGKIGESQMVLSLQALERDFGINYRHPDFYTNPEAFITRLQEFATLTQILHRLFNKSFDDLLDKYTQAYAAGSADWSEFLAQYQHSKEAALKIILGELEQNTPNLNTINNALDTHKSNIHISAKSLLPIPKETVFFEMNKPPLLNQWMTALKDMQKTYPNNSVNRKETRTVKTHAHYETAHAGRTAVFEKVSIFERWERWIGNFRAWRNKEGLLFPNFYAWRTGQLSTQNYFSQLPIFNLFISPKAETREVTVPVHSTYAALMEQLDSKKSPKTSHEDAQNNRSEESNTTKPPIIQEHIIQEHKAKRADETAETSQHNSSHPNH